MFPNLRGLATGVALATGAAAAVYLAVAVKQVRAEGRRRVRGVPENATLSATILKPLYGLDDGLFENLCSFCEQDAGAVQIVFCVYDPADPALEVARRVAARYPDADIEIAIGPSSPARNPKIANLLGAAGRIKHDIVVIADADMRVGREYLRAVLAPFDDSSVGASTCLYEGVPAAGMASQLAALYVNEQFAPSVLVAGTLEPLGYCFGATMAVRRSVLEEAGGLASLASHLADDHRLGEIVRERGLRVALAPYVVTNHIVEASIGTLWRRELRWARTIRGVRPLGYAFSFVTFGVPVAAIAAAVARNRAGVALLLATAGLRYALHRSVRATFAPGDTSDPRLIPLRDLFSVAVWAAAFAGRGVFWRGAALDVDAHGLIERGEPKP